MESFVESGSSDSEDDLIRQGRGMGRRAMSARDARRGRTRAGRVRGVRGRGGRARVGRSRRGTQVGEKARRTRRDGLTQEDIQRIQVMRDARTNAIQEAVGRMTLQQIREFLQKCIEKMPGIIFDVWEMTSPTNGSPPQPSSGTSPPWCKCSNCRLMGSDLENLCCGLLPQNCVSTSEMLNLLLDEHVLQVANRFRHELIVAGHGADNKAKRYAAYRQFTVWRHGHLGEGIRRVIPSCVILRIRHQYPSPTGVYTGYVPGRLA